MAMGSSERVLWPTEQRKDMASSWNRGQDGETDLMGASLAFRLAVLGPKWDFPLGTCAREPIRCYEGQNAAMTSLSLQGLPSLQSRRWAIAPTAHHENEPKY